MESNVAADVPDFLVADLAGKTYDRVDVWSDFPLLSHPVSTSGYACGLRWSILWFVQ